MRPDPAVAAAVDKPVVEARDVEREYRVGGEVVRALRGVSLGVAAGEFLAVTGPSGSGKSTLLHLLGGIDVPTAGRVWLGGTDLARLSTTQRDRRRLLEVGLVFQRFHLLSMLSARENVELPMAEAGVRPADRRAASEALLRRVGLAERSRHRPGELSGGERQRVAIARALANGPRLLLADEPTGELDRGTSEGILDLFAGLNAQGVTIIVATHDLHLAARARRRIELVDGRLAS